MSNGFETAAPLAVNMLTQLAGDYLSNLIQTVKLHQETDSLNRQNLNEALEISLLENGINRPDDLYSYMEAEFEKKPRKLTDVKGKLENFLKDLLRPTLQELSERNFDDESQSFMTGDFASELTGEDFFGFKELGLEKEFGVLSSSVPLQLLSSRFQATDGETEIQVKKLQPEEFDNVKYGGITKETVDGGKYLIILRPLLEKAYDRSKVFTIKPPKGLIIEEKIKRKVHDIESPSYILLEDDELIFKTKGSARLRLPPTGKISTNYKKKLFNDAFVLPEVDEIKPEVSVASPEANTTGQSQLEMPSSMTFDSIDNIDSLDLDNGTNDFDSSTVDSFGLSLPKVDD